MKTRNTFLLITALVPITTFSAGYQTGNVTVRANGIDWTIRFLYETYADYTLGENALAEVFKEHPNNVYYSAIPVATEGVVTVPASFYYGHSSTTTRIGDYAFYACTSITEVKLPNAVSSIGVGAFNGCWNLKTVNIPTGVSKIENLTFHYCKSLQTISLPSGVKEIGDNAFAYCNSLKSIDIPDGATKIGYGVFQKCTALKTVRIPTSVTSVGLSVFSGCSGLETVYLPSRFRSTVSKLEIPSVTSIIYLDDSPTLGVTSAYGTPTPAAGTTQFVRTLDWL